jgi:hypothetical protein
VQVVINFEKMLNKYYILYLMIIFLPVIGCVNNNQAKKDNPVDSMASRVNSKRQDSATLNFTDYKPDSGKPNKNTPSFLNGNKLKTDDYIKHYPANQTAALRRQMEWLRKKWKNVPNPIAATYQGNDFGDYHHILFKAAHGVIYDFGQAKNSYGQYELHELSGQYNDNPEFLGKKFKVYWDWKLAEFLCCNGAYGKAKAYLPAITKLELIINE